MKSVEEWFALTLNADGVVFDFGGVLTVSPVVGWPLYPYCAGLGVDRAAMDAGWRKYRHLWDGGFISFDEMYRRIFADADVPPPSGAQLDRLWELDAVAWIATPRLDSLELMRRVKIAGKRIAILTNMSPDFHERLFVPRMSEYRALADVEVVSGLEHLCKPDRRIYDLTSARIGIPAERLVFFDDTAVNVEAARSFGWQAELFA